MWSSHDKNASRSNYKCILSKLKDRKTSAKENKEELESLELKIATTEIKAQWVGSIAKWETEQRISELDNKTIGITQSELKKENRLKEQQQQKKIEEQSLRDLWYYDKRSNILVIKILEQRRNRVGLKRDSKK